MRHARRVNRQQGWSGHLWANWFYSTALDEQHRTSPGTVAAIASAAG